MERRFSSDFSSNFIDALSVSIHWKKMKNGHFISIDTLLRTMDGYAHIKQLNILLFEYH